MKEKCELCKNVHSIDVKTTYKNGTKNDFYFSDSSEVNLMYCPLCGEYLGRENRKNLSFGQALEEVKSGKKIFRHSWNGKGMFVVYQKGYPNGIHCNIQTAKAWGINEGDLFKCEPYLQIKMVNGSHSMWVPSINDIFAEDWEIVK